MYSYDLILKNGQVVLPSNKIEKIDIAIKNSKIYDLGNFNLSKSKKIIDLNNLHVLPGCIDTQVHFREPGLTHKEDLKSGTKGAVLGGITGIFEMPNTNPPTITKEDFNHKIALADKKSFCDYSFFIGAARENIKNLETLENLPGCCGVKIFMGSSTGHLLVEDDENLKKIFKTGKRIIAVHSEDEYRLRERKYLLSNPNITVKDHEIWRDSLTAIESTKRLLKLSKEEKRKIHILHISTSDEIELIRSNKELVTCEVTPQHLFFNSPECYEQLGSLAQMNPPIRNKNHQLGLWKGLKDNVVDIIGSDHAPHTLNEKNKKYPESPSGMTGVQTLLPILLDFVNKGLLTICDIARLTSYNPAKIYGIFNKGAIKIGNDADFSIFDLKKERIISNEWIASKSGWTPYDGIKVKGWPVFTIIRGEIIMREDNLLAEPSGKKMLFEKFT